MKKIKINDVEISVVAKADVKANPPAMGSLMVVVPDGTDIGTIPAVLLEYFVYEHSINPELDPNKPYYVTLGDMGVHPDIMRDYASGLEKQRLAGEWDTLITNLRNAGTK